LQPIRELEIAPPPPPSGAEDALRVRRFSSIHEIPESVWDGLLDEEHPYHAHRLIRAVEDARVEESRFWALLFYEGGRPVASAVLSAFTVSLDIFLGKALQSLAARVRRWFPRFLRIDVLFCGLPASFGQSNLRLSDAAPARRVLELLVGEMESIARAGGLRFLCIKEFKASELSQVADLERLGFFRGHSIPYMTLDIRWRSFDDYLASLRHSYRRHIRRSLAKMGMTRPEVRDAGGPGPQPCLVLGGAEVVSPQRFHQLYGNVMARSETRLEMLNEAFFERLWAELGRDLQIVAAVDRGEVLGAALLLKSGTTLNFMLVGLPETPQTPYDVYFNLLYAIVDQAIRQGCRRLNLGQTAYWGKQQIGGQPEDEFLFFKASNPTLHAVLRGLRRILFPRLVLESPRVFK
jgi:predicted N-acyltransferase